MNTEKRPCSLPTERPWPPRRVEAAIDPAATFELVGLLRDDAELRIGVGAARSVLLFKLATRTGFPFQVLQPIAGDAGALQAATSLARTLRRGTQVRVRAEGCVPRTDHDHAVLQLIGVTTVTVI